MIFCARAWRSSWIRRVGKGALAPCPPRYDVRKMVGTLRFAHPTARSLRKPRRLLLQRQRQAVREVRYGVVESAQQDDLEYLRLVVMRRQASEFGLAER